MKFPTTKPPPRNLFSKLPNNPFVSNDVMMSSKIAANSVIHKKMVDLPNKTKKRHVNGCIKVMRTIKRYPDESGRPMKTIKAMEGSRAERV